MALAPEAGTRVDERHRRPETVEPIRVEARRDVAFEDADAHLIAESQERTLEQCGLARPRRRHEVDRPHARVAKVVAIRVGDAVVLGEDVLEHGDS